ncbi:DUF3768 domain-containing protein [Methylobacterium sp. J-090]|uniref:DUF3768 domain-containing protein n=1 Tax=Methylobacterium sp. J-090 TaxID=2836666 RepID=UPI001FB91237|nr:DUF3768 domain-containing protein [Methylobacterium sp. J-090]MCJ2084164.1 DUF3768 domain-containing protein [Methylobacterium sp. J-090]
MKGPASNQRGKEQSAARRGAGSISALNDAFRRSFTGGGVVETPAVVALPDADRIALRLAVRVFKDFDADNDPHGEHDFGAIDLVGMRWLWRIDTFNRAMTGHSPDPADTAMTTRVLTIMRADEA